MTESRIEKLTRIGQEMAAAVAEMRADAADVTNQDPETAALVEELSVTCDRWSQWEEVAVVALTHLQSTRRLIPAGGMALTAEQVEDVEALVATANPYSAPAARLRALFPATEPAEVISRYQTMQRGFAAKHFGFPANPVFEDRYTAPDGGKWQWTDELQWELRCYPPAPAVPAGEETKAEVDGDFIEIVFDGPPEAVSGRFVEVENPQGASISVGEWIDRGDGFWALRIPYPSSPVVPAPTETEAGHA